MRPSSIIFIEKICGYTLICYDNQFQEASNLSLNKIEADLHEDFLFRANRSIIINLLQIVEIDLLKSSTIAIMNNGKHVQISRRRKKKLFDLIKNKED